MSIRKTKNTPNFNETKKRQVDSLKSLKVFLWVLLSFLVIFSLFSIFHIFVLDINNICPNNKEMLQNQFSSDSKYSTIALSVCSILATIVIGLNIFSYIDFKGLKDEVRDEINRLNIDSRHLRDKFYVLKEVTNQYKSEVDMIDMNMIKKTNGNLKEIEKTILEQCRTDADHSRMTAFLLKELEKPIWAIGWISRAVKRYFQCCSNIGLKDNYGPITESCHSILMESIRKFVNKVNKNEKTLIINQELFFENYEENKEDAKELFKRTLKDFTDYMIILNTEKYFNLKKIQIKEQNKIDWLVCNLRRASIKNNDCDIMKSFLLFLIKLIDNEELFYKCAIESFFDECTFLNYINEYTEEAKENDLKKIFDNLTTLLSPEESV